MTVNRSVKPYIDESLPALLEKSGKSQRISRALGSGHPVNSQYVF